MLNKFQIPLSASDLTDLERNAMLEVFDSRILSLGPKTVEFEDNFARFVGTKHAVAVNSGTSALHLIVRALGIGRADEVITTPFSFVASSNCILFEGATPVFADIEPNTLNIDPDEVEKKITPRTKAILAVDVFGHPAEWDRLRHIADKHNLLLIEDSCEALGAKFKGQNAGTFANAGCFAFYPNKQITCAEGGMITTNDDNIANLCRSMRNQGRAQNGGWLSHERLGYNYRLSELHSAIGNAQLKRIDEILEKRAKVAANYEDLLKDCPEISLPQKGSNAQISWFVYVVKLESVKTPEDRKKVMDFMAECGIQTNIYFAPIHLQPFYQKEFGCKPGDFPVTERIAAKTLAIPFFANLTTAQAQTVTQSLKQAIALL